MKDVGLLLLRVATGTLMAGHGAQKLFGWFEGPGIEGTTGMVQQQGFRPARPWAWMAALSEFGGGVLMGLGFLNPLGSLGVISAMGTASLKVHWNRPVWATKGGAELPLTNMAIATALALTGPGRVSLDSVLGIRPPRWVVLSGLGLAAAGVAGAMVVSRPEQQQEQQGEPVPVQPHAASAIAVPASPEGTQDRGTTGGQQPESRTPTATH